MSKENLKPCKHYIYYKVQNYYFGECDMCDEENEKLNISINLCNCKKEVK